MGHDKAWEWMAQCQKVIVYIWIWYQVSGMQRKEWLLSKLMLWGNRNLFFCELTQHSWVSLASIGKVVLPQGSHEAWHCKFSFGSVKMWIWCWGWRFWKRFSEVVIPAGHCDCIYRAGYASREELAGSMKAVGEPAKKRKWFEVLHDKSMSLEMCFLITQQLKN